MAKTTEAQFEIFKQECELWIGKLGLLGWDVDYDHVSGESDAEGSATYDIVARRASLVLFVDFSDSDKEITNEEVKVTAKHEVMEVFFGRIHTLANMRHGVDRNMVTEEIHCLISVLEKLLNK